jgi:hypothetical protein
MMSIIPAASGHLWRATVAISPENARFSSFPCVADSLHYVRSGMKDIVRKQFLMAFALGMLASGTGRIFAQSALAPVPNRDRSAAPPHARSVVVPSNVEWTNTGINVTRGQHLRFETSGEILLSFSRDDASRASGSVRSRQDDKSPVPTLPVGALIGRIANGRPFAIGDTTNTVDMPAGGRLFLGVNDDHVTDNSGNFVVKIWVP